MGKFSGLVVGFFVFGISSRAHSAIIDCKKALPDEPGSYYQVRLEGESSGTYKVIFDSYTPVAGLKTFELMRELNCRRSEKDTRLVLCWNATDYLTTHTGLNVQSSSLQDADVVSYTVHVNSRTATDLRAQGLLPSQWLTFSENDKCNYL